MELSEYKVGYWPYRSDFKSPGDRRRFIFFANEKKLNYETADTHKVYDIVYLTMGCNISKWISYKKRYPNVKMIFEIVDSYFLEGFNFFTATRGLTKFLIGKESKLYFDYQKAIIKMFNTVDAVVCSTPIQKDFLLKYNNNVHISLDFFLNDITNKKTNFASTDKLKLLWEGQAYTVHNLLSINSIFKELSHKVELHIITDPVIKYPFKIFDKKTKSLLSSLQCKYYLHDWKKETFSKIITEMDLAIIPLDNSKYGTLTLNKPENKLLLFWQIGIPVLTSDSPAYNRVMKTAEIAFSCSTKGDWKEKIEDFIALSEDNRSQIMIKASNYIDKHHTKEIIIKNWENIFLSLYNI